MTTAGSMLLKIAERLRPLRYGNSPDLGASTPSTDTHIVDPDRTEPTGYFDGGTLFTMKAGQIHAWKILDYKRETWQGSTALYGIFNVGNQTGGLVYTGDYAAADKKYNRDVLMHGLNMALAEIGPFTQIDTALITVNGATEYSLPANVYNVNRVEIAADDNADTWEKPYRYWTERPGTGGQTDSQGQSGGALYFDDGYLPDVDGRKMRLYYDAPHPRIMTEGDTVTDAIHPDVIATLAAIHALRSRIPAAGNSDPEPQQMIQLLSPMYQSLRAANPIRRMQKDSRYPVLIPAWPVGAKVRTAPVTPPPGGGGGGPTPDVTPPGTPQAPGVSLIDSTKINIYWLEVSDNIGVNGYKVYRNGALIGTVGAGVLSFNDTGLTAATTYSYTVSATDAAGNEGAQSTATVVTTLTTAIDTTPPSQVTGLTVGTPTATTVPLSWTAATDNVGVQYYYVYRNGVLYANTIPGVSWTDTNVTPATTYSYQVSAVDAAGNEGPKSSSQNATTSAAAAAVYYVSPSAQDNVGAGSLANPWSFTDAFYYGGLSGPHITAGDTVYLRGGTYNMSQFFMGRGLALAGTNLAHIQVRVYPGERATIRNNNSAGYKNTWELTNVSYVDFYDIEFTMFNYTRDSVLAGRSAPAANIAHVWLDPAYTQNTINFRGCTFHDCAGGAIKLNGLSVGIVFEGCIFYYNGTSTGDYTSIVRGALNSGNGIKNCVFLHNGADDIRVWSTAADPQVVKNINILDNFILNSGGLFADPARAVLAGAESATPTTVAINNNVVYNRQAADTNSRAYQVGKIGTPSSTTLDVQINSSVDDGRWSSAGDFTATGTSIQMGVGGSNVHWNGWYKFNTISIPQGATITSASMDIVTANSETGGLKADLSVYGNAADNAAAPTTAADANGKATTTANANWVIGPNWANTITIGSPQLAAVVQEIISRAGWVSGNSLMLLIKDNLSTADVWAVDRSGSPASAAILHITYQTVAGDGGANAVTGTGNTLVGQPVDLSGTGYVGVTFTGNTIDYTGSHIGGTQAGYPTNTWNNTYPGSGTSVFVKPYSYNAKQANLLVINWAGAASATVLAAALSGVTIASGDTYTLSNCEDFYSDRISGVYDGVSIVIPMTGRTQAATFGAIGNPATLYPTVGIFRLEVTTGSGAGNPPSVPTGLTATATSGGIALSWQPSTGDVSGYKVYRNGSLIANPTATNYLDTSATPGVAYTYRVAAVSSTGINSAQSNSATATRGLTGFFVSPSGSSSNPGSLASPWSFDYMMTGAGGAITPGSTVWVRGGTYNHAGQTNVALNGTAANPISVRAYPGEVPIINDQYVSATQWYYNTASFVRFYDLVWTCTGYNRATEQAQGVMEQSNGGVTSGANGVKFFGCTFKNAATHGFRAFEQAGDLEFNGCIIEFNGANNQYDHGCYVRNELNTPKYFRNCIFAHNAGHGFHGYASMSGTTVRYEDNLTVQKCLIFQNGSLYNAQTRQALIGPTSSIAENNIFEDNVIFTNLGVDSNAEAFRLGYGGGHRNNVIRRNIFAGSPVLIEAGGTGETYSDNALYYNGSQRGATLSVMTTANGNSVQAIPSAGTIKKIYPFDWDTRRASLAILNWGGAASVQLLHSDLVGAGLTIVAGDQYELHNAENYYNDVITGVYDGAGITVPMTGRSVETPYGLGAPASGFPVFGAFIIRTKTP